MSKIDRASGHRPSDPAAPVSVTSPLERDGGETLHGQVERRLREAIADGRLRPGARLASTRGLAAELGIARITAQTAYDQLIAEGYLEVEGRAGTRVARDLPTRGFDRPDPTRADEADQRYPRRNAWALEAPVTAPTRAHAAATELGPEWFGLDAFDVRGWERLLVRAWRELVSEPDSAVASYAGPPGDERLRAALADHLAVRRDVRCGADDIAVTAGLTAGIAAIARTWLGPGRVCVVEDPGGGQLRRALGGAGARIVPVPVDDHGLRIAMLPERADVVFVTPSWQYPAGGSLSLPRRLALLRWAAAVGAIVIEDDCESELRYEGQPLPSLQGLAPAGRVIYLGTFSKVLFPGLRTGYMVVPGVHRGLLLAALEAGSRGPAVVEQRALALLLEGGGFHRHIRRLRNRYAERRDAFASALAATGARLEVRRASAGGHLVVGIVDPCWSGTTLAAAAAVCGIRIEPLSANRLLDGPDDELVVYLSRLDADALAAAARELGRLTRDGPIAQPAAASLRSTAGRIPPAR
jgi:GntR family transcriptional regulator/MocR family aminotransferase